MKYLITGGCSFSHQWVPVLRPGWIELLEYKLQARYPELQALHTGHNGQGQEMIQKKVSMTIIELLEQGVDPADILVVVMWSGTFRKSWYIDNEQIIRQLTEGMVYFHGGMDPVCIDLKNSVGDNPKYFKTANGDEFPYNPAGGWYSTVNGSDCNMPFVQQYYMLDGFHGGGVGKVHGSLENIINLQNFCRLKGIKLFNQFFMDHVYQDIEQNKNHQIINYLYKQFDFDNTITEGMFETLHELIDVPRDQVYKVTHEDRKKFDNNAFNPDGFHPGTAGAQYWCDKRLYPLLESKGIL